MRTTLREVLLYHLLYDVMGEPDGVLRVDATGWEYRSPPVVLSQRKQRTLIQAGYRKETAMRELRPCWRQYSNFGSRVDVYLVDGHVVGWVDYTPNEPRSTE